MTKVLNPSPQRARNFNRAYREIVKEQSFIKGRDAVLHTAKNVHKEVEQNQSAGIEEPATATIGRALNPPKKLRSDQILAASPFFEQLL
nr:hypothetical protein [uncultured Cohaesibacter sp.]